MPSNAYMVSVTVTDSTTSGDPPDGFIGGTYSGLPATVANPMINNSGINFSSVMAN